MIPAHEVCTAPDTTNSGDPPGRSPIGAELVPKAVTKDIASRWSRTGKRLAKTQWQSLWLTIDRRCSWSARTRRFDDGMQKAGNCSKPSDRGDNVLRSFSGPHAYLRACSARLRRVCMIEIELPFAGKSETRRRASALPALGTSGRFCCEAWNFSRSASTSRALKIDIASSSILRKGPSLVRASLVWAMHHCARTSAQMLCEAAPCAEAATDDVEISMLTAARAVVTLNGSSPLSQRDRIPLSSLDKAHGRLLEAALPCARRHGEGNRLMAQ